ncbi:MAG: DNA polymerase IV [Candidatus Marinimicrobia bacterium]|nr:DNA polymerase IV [Candidatus Neomarinimicrobiota bacterium]MCF7828420.1 DNA polymerase IV [Candidatus Neomarinimicrobiota bacterium]MCF7880986.1 DNA polymerase IV [Candidatus Neomarinimicrobiota bacterium]
MPLSPHYEHNRLIAHVDMDCFFVAVERLKDPSLIGKPVVVGGNPEGRGVISSASYEAREYGVHSAMPAGRAKKLCPQAIFLRGSFSDYTSYSRDVRAVLEEFTPLVEMASIDEAYLDLTGTERLFGQPMEIAEIIRMRILDKTGLVASFGVGTNKLIAKIASDYGKPDAITYVRPGFEAAFLAPMDIRKLPGIGPSTGGKLKSLGITTIGELAEYEEDRLSREFHEHKRAGELRDRARGISYSPVKPERERKSISKEVTFHDDITDPEYLKSVLHYLVEQVAVKLRSLNQHAWTINLKYRYPDFETHTRANTMNTETDQDEVIFSAAEQLLDDSADIQRGIRLIGVGVSQLTDQGEAQLGLFEESASETEEASKRTKAVDELRKKFGFDSVVSAQSINIVRRKNVRRRGNDEE